MLLAGEVDSVMRADGSTMLLKRAQGHVRIVELAKQAAILNALPEHIALLDSRGVVVTVNDAWRQFADNNAFHGPDHGVGVDYLAVCDKASGDSAAEAADVAAGIRAVLDGTHDRFGHEYACHGVENPRWFRLTVTRLFGVAAGGAVLMHSDITEQKLADLAVEQTAQLLQAVVSGTPDTVFVKDRDGRYLLCNEAFARFTGRTVAQMLGQNNTEIFGQEAGLVLTGVDQEVLDSGQILSTEDVLPGVNGPRTFLTIKAPYRDATGRINGVLGISRDISDRKEASHERDRQRVILRTLIDALPDAIYTKDAAGRFVVSNRAAQSSLGFAKEEDLAGKSPFDLLPPPLAAAVHVSDTEVLAGHQILDQEHKFLDEAGNVAWRSTIKVPLRDSAGEINGLVGIERDISALKRHQQALEDLNKGLETRVSARTQELKAARDEAQQASDAKSSFLATMSHEIRTPMNGVIGMLEVFEKTSMDDDQAQMLLLIRESAFSLLAIIEDILDFSKIEAGKLEVECVPIQLGQIVENVSSMLDSMAMKMGVRMTVFVDPAIADTLLGDGGRLRQVLVNLVSNAIKFSGGRALPGRVSLRAVLAQNAKHLQRVELVVTDDGIGIDEVTQSRLFEPFAQADASTTRRFGGTGLGLAICRMLVELMGGCIGVASSVGIGSTFTVRLAMKRCRDDHWIPVLPSASTASLAGVRIVGAELPLAHDLAATIAKSGAVVRFSDTLEDAVACATDPMGWPWLVLPDQDPEFGEEPRVTACLDARPRLQFGWGAQRRPKRIGTELVRIDINTLTRKNLWEALRTLAMGSSNEVTGTVLTTGHQGLPGIANLPTPVNKLGRRILVAEDNDTNRKVIVYQLAQIGLSATLAVNGAEALSIWRAGRYDLLLTDLRMPLMDGYALTAAIRAEEVPGTRMPIVALTANALREEELRCRDAGMDGYLTKPVRISLLESVVESLLSPLGTTSLDRVPAMQVVESLPPVNLDILGDLIGNDLAMRDVVLQAFRTSAAAAVLEMNRRGPGQGMGVAEVAHSLKSAARSIGALTLGELCATIEQDAHTADEVVVAAWISRLEEELCAVNQFLSTTMKKGSTHDLQ